VSSEKPGGLPIPYRAESIDAFLEVLQGRRSIRTGFLMDKPVPDELIEKILEAARWAPSAGNSQPWESLVIRDLEIREKIVKIFKTQMRDKIEIEEATRGQRRRVNCRSGLPPCAGPCTRARRSATAARRSFRTL
jgi:nitroreductase